MFSAAARLMRNDVALAGSFCACGVGGGYGPVAVVLLSCYSLVYGAVLVSIGTGLSIGLVDS